MGYPFVFVKKSKNLFLASSAVALLAMTSPVQAQDNILMPDSPPVGVSAQPPSQESLDDLDRQLANIQNMINQANAESEENGNSLPVIDPQKTPDVFYDSMPVRRGVQPTAPEKMDPIAKPAGKVVYVQKDFDPGEDQSLLVSAKRALSLGRYDSALGFYD